VVDEEDEVAMQLMLKVYFPKVLVKGARTARKCVSPHLLFSVPSVSTSCRFTLKFFQV
jgi:hypothetical protein